MMLTCISCLSTFTSSQEQKDHMQGDWHRYNLKRKVVELPPVSLAAFNQKLNALKMDVPEEPMVYQCIGCRKTFASNGAFKTHLLSKKHKAIAKTHDNVQITSAIPKSQVPVRVAAENDANNWKTRLTSAKSESEIDDILVEKMKTCVRLTETDCLFCSCESSTFEANIAHMAEKHSFFIPDIDRMADIKGLVKYLGDKIAVANVCIYCNGQGKTLYSLEAVQAHMVSKSHCKIPFENGEEDEIAEFYNFTPEATEWEDVEGDVDMQSVTDTDEIVDDESIDEDVHKKGDVYMTETQLVLASGVKIGHRAFKRYWSQNIRSQVILPGSANHPEMLSRLSQNYRVMGYNNSADFQKLVHRQTVLRERQKQHKMLGNYQKVFLARVGRSGNNQRHFRDPTGLLC